MPYSMPYSRMMVIEKLAQLGTRRNVLESWARCSELDAVWRRIGKVKGRHNSGHSWIRKTKENAVLAEMIYRTYIEAYPANASLTKQITWLQLYELYLILVVRFGADYEPLSTNRIYYLLQGIASKELKVNGICKTCKSSIVDDIYEINSQCALCRFYLKRCRLEQKPDMKATVNG